MEGIKWTFTRDCFTARNVLYSNQPHLEQGDLMTICGCEHIRHDLDNTMPYLAPEIPRDGHPIFTEQEGTHPHAWVGEICDQCYETCTTQL
jgi:hypothetical protein